MSYYPTKKQGKYNPASKVFTQRELIEQINAHTRFTHRFAELLIRQSDPISNQFRKDKQNGR